MSQANSDDLFSEGGALIVPDEQGEEMFPQEEEGYGSAPASQPNLYSKRGFDIYSMLLALSFFFLMLATILFFVEVGRFN